MTNKIARIVLFAAMAILGSFIVVQSAQAQAMTSPSSKKAVTETDLQLALRSLWVDHIFWVRNVVLMTKLGDNAAVNAAEQEVVTNAKTIADSITPYYGATASTELLSLLEGHYTAIKDYMTADFKGDSAGKAKALQAADKNADDIASFLSSANPSNWPKDALIGALRSHVGMHVAQIDDINKGQYVAGAKVWEEEKSQIYSIADTLAMGIAKQFALAGANQAVAAK